MPILDIDLTAPTWPAVDAEDNPTPEAARTMVSTAGITYPGGS